MAKYRNDNWSDFVEITRALGDENRLKILAMLEISEMCVCQITDILKSSRSFGLAPSTVSRHLSILHSAGLIVSSKRGRWIYYSLNVDSIRLIEKTLRFVLESMSSCDEIARIRALAKKTLKKDPDLLCKRLYGEQK